MRRINATNYQDHGRSRYKIILHNITMYLGTIFLNVHRFEI